MPSNNELIDWHASDWDKLINIWRDLVGTIEEPVAAPIFKGEELSYQEAGYVFQTWIIEAFRLSIESEDKVSVWYSADIEGPYKVQIKPNFDNRTLQELDGILTVDGRSFLIETKFSREDFGTIARLHMLVESRPVGCLGLLFAVQGFTAPASESAQFLRPIRVLLFGRQDIEYAINIRDFTQTVQLKLRNAAKYGRCDSNLITTEEAKEST